MRIVDPAAGTGALVIQRIALPRPQFGIVADTRQLGFQFRGPFDEPVGMLARVLPSAIEVGTLSLGVSERRLGGVQLTFCRFAHASRRDLVRCPIHAR
ncbi:MAG: hypothetical protein ACTMIY_10690, partial [Microbacterium gubbeenense]